MLQSAGGIVAFAVCAGLLPLIRRLAAKWSLYDQPGELKIHRQPVARIGGAAMMAGIMACLGASWLGSPGPYGLCLLALVTVWAVGFADDLRSLSVGFRLAAQCAAAALLWSGGWRLHWSESAGLDLIPTVLFVVFVINAMNWLDGMDGVAAATAAAAAAGFLWLPIDSLARLAAWALLGVCLGILLMNFPPASVFMGDSGSMLLGALLAFLCLDWVRVAPQSHSVALPALIIALPLGDGVFAMVRRLRTRSSPFRGDRRHFYDLLSARGWPAHGVMLVSVLMTGGFALLAGIGYPVMGRAAIALGIAGLLVLAYVLGSLRPDAARGDLRRAISPVHSIGMTLRRISHS